MDTPKSKHELMIMALQQRIGEIVSQYETTVASLRADLTQMMEVNNILSKSSTTVEKEESQCLKLRTVHELFNSMGVSSANLLLGEEALLDGLSLPYIEQITAPTSSLALAYLLSIMVPHVRL